MTMKLKYGLPALLSAALLTLGGCVSTDEFAVETDIRFRPVIGTDTRAEDGIPFPEAETFRVWASDTENGGGLYLDGETVSHGSRGWTASRRWSSGTLSFGAVHPSDLPGAGFDPAKGLTLSGYTTGGADVLVAESVQSYTRTGAPVVLEFGHILSRLAFRVSQAYPPSMVIRIEKIELKGLALEGSYGLREKGEWQTTGTGGTLTVYDAAAEQEGNGPATGTPQYYGADCFVIPQVFRGEIEVTYSFQAPGCNPIPGQKFTTGLFETRWEPSTRYTYSLTLSDQGLAFTTGLGSWNTR
jgi:hypothetical protein